MKKIHVHFMGICGSGAASIAMLAVKAGYLVTGCDQKTDSYYADELKKNGVRIYEGHDRAHLTADVDAVAVSPAIFDINPDCEELLLAKEKGILMTWQQFMGEYLQKDKKVIAISGTHGKTTTTFLAAELLIAAGFDPSVVGGSVYSRWNTGGRYGKSPYFLCEADEFNRNFHHYRPTVAVLNNVEMDHPECYKDLEEVISSFTEFVTAPKTVRTLIVNGDSEGAVEVLRRALSDTTVSAAQVYVMTGKKELSLPFDVPGLIKVAYEILERSENGTAFSVNIGGKALTFRMRLTGDYNVMNAVTAVTIVTALGGAEDSYRDALYRFSGAGRRFDRVGTVKNVPVYDDYAHHPTEIASLLTMCRDYFPDKKLLAIFEPHQISRLRLMFRGYVDALTIAHRVVIWRTHLGREIHANVTPIPKETWEEASPRIHYEEDADKIVDYAKDLIDQGECDMILVIGAASSYLVSRKLIDKE